MVRLHEFQGKQLLKSAGIMVAAGDVASSREETRKISETIKKPVAIKAQVWTTGRFKAGGIRFAFTSEEAESLSNELLSTHIKGFKVEKVLIEEKLDIEHEFYVGIIINDSFRVRSPVIIFSMEGGVDIEEIAKKSPNKIVSYPIDYLDGINRKIAQELVSKLNIESDLVDPLSKVIIGLYDVFTKYNARAVEINPLVLTRDRQIYAADCRITIDDNSIFCHPEFGIKVPRDMPRTPTKLEELAWKIEEGDYRGTGYFTQMITEFKEGETYIGLHGIGGGGAMLAASALLTHGFKIANYADTSGDPPASKVYRVIKIIFMQPIDTYVLMGSCLANQEQWHHAHAIVRALNEELIDRPGFPVLLLLAGNREKESHEIIKNGLKTLPIRWELYGRDYVYQTDFICARVKALVDDYLAEKGDEGG
ncbi:MAG: ATP-grasp domain-containing protein [Candidatus Heimdallarchaeota archaeon]